MWQANTFASKNLNREGQISQVVGQNQVETVMIMDWKINNLDRSCFFF